MRLCHKSLIDSDLLGSNLLEFPASNTSSRYNEGGRRCRVLEILL